ncbi:MAG TPA: DHH family phosphoesterase [Oscillospiraceae bacterium]|nr:DHH family phosphoesterase [Oscillospiraceae bacterium]
MNKKIARLLEPGLRMYFFFLLAFAVASAFFNYYLAAVEVLLVVLLYAYFRANNASRRKQILKYIDAMATDVDAATKDTVLNAPLPMLIFRADTDEVIWSNDRFLQISGEREHLFDTKITNIVPDFSARWLIEGKSRAPELVSLGGRRYMVFGHMSRDGGARGLIATTYWQDITDYAGIKDEYEASRPVAAILLMDNYEELFGGVPDNVKSQMLSDVDRRIVEWAAPARGLLSRYDRDRYLFLFEERYLSGFKENKFSVLEAVREVINPSNIAATLSIGIGREADSFEDLFKFAALSIDMALSRGGDQAVLRNRVNFEFYGGRAKELERRTKVKARVMASALGDLVGDASRVLVMGHKSPDADCIGAAAGVCAIARKRGRKANIVLDAATNLADRQTERLRAMPEYADVFVTPQDALVLADARTLLVVVDTNRPETVESQDLLLACNRVAVIDHHRRANTYITDAALNLHEVYVSSTSELVTELLQYLLEPADLRIAEAEALLAGIVLDSKNFTMRTGSRTFEAAAFLRRAGADTADVKKFFQNDFAGTMARYSVIRSAQLYRGNLAIAAVKEDVGRIVAGQAADELLTIAGLEAAFVLVPEGGGSVLSARSLGDVNVQAIAERLGGGGNGTNAGAQLPDLVPDAAAQKLANAIDAYYKEERS